MALVASVLIQDARARTFGQHGRQKISDAALLSELSYQDMHIVQQLSQIAPTLLTYVDGLSPVTLSENQYGYNLDAGLHYRDFTHVAPSDNVYTKINIVSRDHYDRSQSAPSATLNVIGSGAVLWPIDPEGTRWQSTGARVWFDADAGHEIHYSYVPLPVRLTALSDELTSPDFAREIFITALELAILTNNPGANPIRIQQARERYMGAQMSFLFQAHKFVHPAGQYPTATYPTEGDWVRGQIG